MINYFTFDLNENVVLLKSFGKKDISKLVPKDIINKRGIKQRVYVKNEEKKKKVKRKNKEEELRKQLSDVLKFAEKLGLEIKFENQYRNQSAKLKRYKDKYTGKIIRAELIIPKNVKLEGKELKKIVWHEIGHFLDEARYVGGRSNFYSSLTWGNYSYKNKDILKKYADFINEDIKIPVIIKYDKKRYESLDEFLSDKNIPESEKALMKLKVKDRENQIKSYLNQVIELFANGFAKFMIEPKKVKEKAPELFELYDKILKEKKLK